MAYDDTIRPASFRGVPFKVETSGASFGRRAARHQFPGQDRPWTEDLGRMAREFEVEGFVIGADAIAQREALQRAAEQEGPGDLVHPHYGQLRVVCLRLNVREILSEKRLARILFTFAEAGEAAFPRAQVNGLALANKAAVEMKDSAQGLFGDLFDLSGLPGFAELPSLQTLRTYTSKLASYALSGPPGSVADFQRLLEPFLGPDLSLALSNGTSLAADLRVIFDALEDGWGPEDDDLAAYSSLLDLGADQLGGGSSLHQRADAQAAALAAYMAQLAAASAVRAAAATPWDTYDAAVAARDALSARLDALIAGAADELFPSLERLQSILSQTVPPEEENLPRLQRVTLRATEPAVVLAYRLHGTRELEADIVRRNRIRRPGFLPVGRPLEVLSVVT